MLLIRDLDVLEELSVLPDIDPVLHPAPAKPVERHLHPVPEIAPCKLVAQILLILLHKIAVDEGGERQLRL